MARVLMISVVLLAGVLACSRVCAGEAAPAEMKPYEETIPGFDVKFEMVPIPGGTYLMGSPEAEPGRKKDEGPQHEVVIKPFWMGKYEVTWEEFDIFAFKRDVRRKSEQGVNLAQQSESEKLADGVSRPTAPYTDMTFSWGKGGKPALCFTHHAAMEYCRWLSVKTGKAYRLPTEAEWEYAARAGAKTAYFWGDDPAKAGDYAWFADNSEKKPHPVGEKKPNPFGLYDILGNVTEWCLDHYEPKFYAKFKDAPAVQPVVLPDGEEYSYVARGGAWSDKVQALRSAARQGSDEEWSMQDPQFPKSVWWHTDAKFVGFRVVRPVEEQENLKGLKSKVQLTSSRQE
ncbi:MAG: formylglycine-generating enzyme family protein [Planctomycetota bacterium]|nr:formylglycine-generating enzyme family protein [Planctomycetota bacterium]